MTAEDRGDAASRPGLSSLRDEAAGASSPEASIPIAVYESAVLGRQQFRRAYWQERNAVHGLSAAIATALKHLDGCRFMWNGPIHQAASALRAAQAIEARRAETAQQAPSIDENPTPQGDAP